MIFLEKLENKDVLFGVSAVRDNSASPIVSSLKQFVRLQPLKFWMYSYVISIIVYFLLSKSLQAPVFFYYINVLLFPFSVMLVGKVANFFYFSAPWMHALLYPSFRTASGLSSSILKGIMLIIKIIIYVMVWNYTFFVGIIGLLVAMSDVKNFSK